MVIAHAWARASHNPCNESLSISTCDEAWLDKRAFTVNGTSVWRRIGAESPSRDFGSIMFGNSRQLVAIAPTPADILKCKNR